MSYENVGAFISGRRPSSKAALKRALLDAPDTVRFDTTSFFTTVGEYTVDTLPVGLKLSWCGPDPHRDRRAYGTVERNPKTGRVTLT